MSGFGNIFKRFQGFGLRRLIGVSGGLALFAILGIAGFNWLAAKPNVPSDISSQSRRTANRYTPSPAEWSTLTVEPVTLRFFRNEHQTEGKIAVDEDRATPVFSPYAGRVTRLLAKPGDRVTQGQPLFVVEATDNVQAQNDFITAVTSLNKARSQLDLAQIQNRRAQDLFTGKAVPLKDVQTAEAALTSAQNDVRSAEVALEAVRNRLRILGHSDEAINTFQTQGRISPDTTIAAPISGTVVQRKIGPGQYVSTGSTDPVFVIGDLSSVWVTAFVREVEAPEMVVGQQVSFSLLAYANRTFTARINYVATAIDPATRRLTVRATIDNPDGVFKPEMFANVTIYSESSQPAIAVPKQALIYEGSDVRVWAVNADNSLELRAVKTGLTNANLVAVRGNLAEGEKVVTKGSLFIDRAASGS
jgi:cobalt-zinc-cadmium efflux system membrane fusion protein